MSNPLALTLEKQIEHPADAGLEPAASEGPSSHTTGSGMSECMCVCACAAFCCVTSTHTFVTCTPLLCCVTKKFTITEENPLEEAGKQTKKKKEPESSVLLLQISNGNTQTVEAQKKTKKKTRKTASDGPEADRSSVGKHGVGPPKKFPMNKPGWKVPVALQMRKKQCDEVLIQLQQCVRI